MELGESQAHERWTSPNDVAAALVAVPRHIVVEDSYARKVWVELPPDVNALLDEAWAEKERLAAQRDGDVPDI